MNTTRVEPRDAEVTLNGVRLHYVDWGTEGRPPLVLLHGFSAHARFWDGFAAKMRGDYHVYALDQRGHGDSDWTEDYPQEAMPADLAAFADHLGLDRFTLVGHSMGGGVAFRYAAEHPERVERLIIVDAGLPSPERPPLPGRENSVTRSLAVEFYDNEDAALAHFARMNPHAPEDRLRTAVRHSFRALPDGRYTYKFDPKLRGRLANPGDVEEYKRQATDLLARVGRFTGPMLLVRGEHSDILSPEAAAETVAAFANGSLVTVPNTGHNVPTDDARGFRHAVRQWLDLPDN